LQKNAIELGTRFVGTKEAPGKEAVLLKPVKIGLWDSNGGSMPSGWARWILERFDYDFKVIYNLSDAKLREKYDVLLLVDGALGGGAKGGGGGGKGGGGGGAGATPNLKAFLEAGGTVLTIGGSTGLGKQLGLELGNPVAGLAREKYFIPYSVLRVHVDNTQPLAWGMNENVDVVFNNSPTFKITQEAADKFGINKLAWFDTKTPLRSGFALGQQNLEGGVTMLDFKVGKGRLALFGPQVIFRAQPHGTFKLVFNGIVQAGMKE
jgi:hypothetical protein